MQKVYRIFTVACKCHEYYAGLTFTLRSEKDGTEQMWLEIYRILLKGSLELEHTSVFGLTISQTIKTHRKSMK